MRILFTIAHFYNPSGDGKHASQRNDPQPRLNALTSLRDIAASFVRQISVHD
jgi:hypothetical protein